MRKVVTLLAVLGLFFAVQGDVLAGSACCGTAKESKDEVKKDDAKTCDPEAKGEKKDGC